MDRELKERLDLMELMALERKAEALIKRKGHVYCNKIKCTNIRQVRLVTMLTSLYFTNKETTEYLAENDDLLEFADSVYKGTVETKKLEEAK